MNTREQETSEIALRSEDQEEIKKLYSDIRQNGRAQLVSPEGKSRSLPNSLYHFLVEVMTILREAKCVTIIEDQAKLTTVEAASLLGVSRQFLVNMLKNNEIPYHMVGTHRRIYACDLFTFKAKRDQLRKSIILDLASAEASEGLYDRNPVDGD